MNVRALMELVNAQSNDRARRDGIMTLGVLRDGLAVLPPESPVYLADGDTPRELSSYRGYYERLAIEPSESYPPPDETRLDGGGPGFESSILGYYQPGASGVRIAAPCTAAELIKALNLADGQDFEGYKGGQFTMNDDTFMHVAANGDIGPYISALRVEADRVVIETTAEEW